MDKREISLGGVVVGLLFLTLAVSPGLYGQFQRGPRIISPEIHPNNTVTFRIMAPRASEVRIRGEWMPGFGASEALIPSDSGLWSVTLGPLMPEFYGYSFLVDSVQVLDPLNGLIKRDGVRIARAIRRPESIEAGKKWIHVDLSEQTLVAYEGDEPIYATVISSGKEGYEPPTGLFEIEQKYISTTMNATDPIDGFYEVEEVPWTLYYHGGYALHGAYWHTDFGKVRSHGCTNISPVDARWLYYWSDPKVPPAWHAVRFQPDTTWVYFTN